MAGKKSFKERKDEIFNDWNKKSKRNQGNSLIKIFEEYLFWRSVEELFESKKQKLRETADRLLINPEVSPVIRKITEEKIRCQQERGGIAFSIQALFGLNAVYLIRWVEHFTKLPKSMLKRIEERAEDYVKSTIDALQK